MLLVAAGLCAGGIFVVGQRREAVRVGYGLGKAMAELRTLEEEERRLDLELNLLTAPARIERVASELGMIRPSPTAIRVVRPRSVASTR